MVRALVLPNLGEYGKLVGEEGGEGTGRGKEDAEMVVGAVVGVLETLVDGQRVGGVGKGEEEEEEEEEEQRNERLKEKVGDVIAARVLQTGRRELVEAILDA